MQGTKKETTKQELLKFGSDWAEAMVANDAERIGSFMSDDWVIVSDRGIATKQRFLSFVESGALTHSAFEMGDERDLDSTLALLDAFVTTEAGPLPLGPS